MLLSPRRARRRGVWGTPEAPSPEPSPGSIIPYDYAASFVLTGRPGNIVPDVINVSTEGTFVAVAIGYGFEEDRAESISLDLLGQERQPSGVVLPGDITLGEIPLHALIQGFRINPRLRPLALSIGQARRREEEFSDQMLSAGQARWQGADPAGDLLFERLRRPAEISFLFSILDSGSGRELQDEP